MIDWEPLHAACMGAFGEAVIYTAPGRIPQVISAVFDRAYLQLFPMGGAIGQEPRQMGAAGNVTAAKPILGVQLSQFHSPPVTGGAIRLSATRGNLLFTIKEVQDDGHGAAKLLLMKA